MSQNSPLQVEEMKVDKGQIKIPNVREEIARLNRGLRGSQRGRLLCINRKLETFERLLPGEGTGVGGHLDEPH